MKTFLFGSVAAIGLALSFVPQKASAYWAYRTAYRWDPICCRYVAFQEPVWVPDPCPPAHFHRHDSRSWYRGGWRDPIRKQDRFYAAPIPYRR
jgi:hypothetical protein